MSVHKEILDKLDNLSSECFSFITNRILQEFDEISEIETALRYVSYFVLINVLSKQSVRMGADKKQYANDAAKFLEKGLLEHIDTVIKNLKG